MNPLNKTGEMFEIQYRNPKTSFISLKDGPVYKVTYEIEKEWFDNFNEANTPGMVLASVCHVSEDGQFIVPNDDSKGDHGGYIEKIYKRGTFNVKEVKEALGTDDQYQEWCRRKPCIICGDYDYTDEYPDGICEYAHVRRKSGVGMKPKYSGVPMCHEHHALQHQKGESFAYAAHLGEKKSYLNSHELHNESIVWFERKAADHLRRWCHDRLKVLFKVDSLSKLDPRELLSWARRNGIEKYFPSVEGYL